MAIICTYVRADLAMESLVERPEVAQRPNNSPIRRRVWVGPHTAYLCGRSRELCPDSSESDEEELVIGVVKTRQLHALGRTGCALPGSVGLSETRVGDVFPICELQISFASLSLSARRTLPFT